MPRRSSPQNESLRKKRFSRMVPIHAFLLFLSFMFSEFIMYLSFNPPTVMPLLFGALYALAITFVLLSLPKIPAMILFAVGYAAMTLWSLVQVVYYSIFGRLIWTNDTAFASDSVIFLEDIFDLYIPPVLWVIAAGAFLLLLTVLIMWPKVYNRLRASRRRFVLSFAACVLALIIAEHSPLVCQNGTAYGALPIYNENGLYHLLKEDVVTCRLSRYLPGYEETKKANVKEIDQYFMKRPEHEANEMTGALEGKNVIVVLMESLDDWMLSPEETPALDAIMRESVVFTDFYTTFYGTTRSINTEVCLNTGLFFPTNGAYFYDYLGNSFDESLTYLLKERGYTSQIFHHNYPDYYRRTELIPAIGYDQYNSYIDSSGQERVLNDCYPFDCEEMRSQFFREGPTFNLLITQAAHMPYVYTDPMSVYALEKHPEYRGAYDTEEEDCIRAKARLVDDTFIRLFSELEKEGLLDDTVILALSDHYPYGYSDTERLLEYADHAQDVLLLDNTPCFIWSRDLAPMTVTKTLNTSDLLPTLLNLLGIPQTYNYLGRDAFDPNYEGCAFFPDGSWATGGVVCRASANGRSEEAKIVQNKYEREITDEWIQKMLDESRDFTKVSNLMLISDYYAHSR